MITFIAFLFTLAGSINWLLIGLLQYDYIAGFFGFQASFLSRIFYVLFGVGAIYLVVRIIVNKGSVKVWERKNKKKKEKEQQPALVQTTQVPVYSNVEASQEKVPNPEPQKTPEPHFENLREFKNFEETPHPENFNKGILPHSDSLFDEHINYKN